MTKDQHLANNHMSVLQKKEKSTANLRRDPALKGSKIDILGNFCRIKKSTTSEFFRLGYYIAEHEKPIFF